MTNIGIRVIMRAVELRGEEVDRYNMAEKNSGEDRKRSKSRLVRRRFLTSKCFSIKTSLRKVLQLNRI